MTEFLNIFWCDTKHGRGRHGRAPGLKGPSKGLKFYSDILSALRARPPGATVAISSTGVPVDVLNGRTARQLQTANLSWPRPRRSRSPGGVRSSQPL